MFQLIIKFFGLVKDFSSAKECYGKRWFTSKVLWANAIALIALVAQTYAGFALTAEEQIAILAVVNIVLRLFTTQPVVTKEENIVCSEEYKKDNPETVPDRM